MYGSRRLNLLATLLSALTATLGLALVVITLVAGGGPLARGFVIGLLLAVVGSLRLWLSVRA